MTVACPACVAPPPAQPGPARAPDAVLSVPGLHCPACIARVEAALTALPDVRLARVNLTQRRVNVTGPAAPEALIAALADAGYEAHAFDPGLIAGQTDTVARDLTLRLGVAGFAMMNVMLLSVAVWSGASDATRDMFHLISAAIAVPAALFSARPFFDNAYAALRALRLNMDVPISLAIVLAAGMSLFEALNGGAHAYFDAALSLTFFLLIGRLLEHRTRAAARSAASDLAALEDQTARRYRGGVIETVPTRALAIGDRVHVPTGTRVPVDGSLSGAAVTDRAFLTGESDPVTHAAGAVLRAGEVNLGAPFTLTATAVGEDTQLRQIARLVETAESARNRYTSLADRAARIYAPAVHLLALATFLGWLAVGSDVRQALNVAIAVLIITCPCALGLAVPAVSTAAIGRLFSLGFLVKSGTALERLAEADVAVLDKTGTLTQPGATFDLGALGDAERSVALGLAQHSAHPISVALAQALAGTTPATIDSITEVPGQGVRGVWNGFLVELGRSGTPGAGLNLSIGPHTFPLPSDEVIRPGAKALAPALTDLGLDVQMLSGDARAKAAAMADRLGIDSWQADMTPEGKTAHLAALAGKGHRTVMIGDGINDTAALAAAHASVAPSTALEAARNAADVILLKPSLAPVPTLIRVARMASRLSRQNFAIAAGYNMVAIPLAVLGYASPLLAALAMSTSSITVLLNALRVRWTA